MVRRLRKRPHKLSVLRVSLTPSYRARRDWLAAPKNAATRCQHFKTFIFWSCFLFLSLFASTVFYYNGGKLLWHKRLIRVKNYGAIFQHSSPRFSSRSRSLACTAYITFLWFSNMWHSFLFKKAPHHSNKADNIDGRTRMKMKKLSWLSLNLPDACMLLHLEEKKKEKKRESLFLAHWSGALFSTWLMNLPKVSYWQSVSEILSE